jgi:hypothetical protein
MVQARAGHYSSLTSNPIFPMSFRPLLVIGVLAVAAAAVAQTTPATNRPNPSAPPRPDAPGAPINPQQASTPAQAVSGGTSQPAAAEPATAPAPLRELNFAAADVDGDKRISLTEFSNYVGNRPANSSTDPITADLIERFRQLDQNGDAYLSEAEATAPAQSQQPLASPVPPRR